jgi:hypothetical protein
MANPRLPRSSPGRLLEPTKMSGIPLANARGSEKSIRRLPLSKNVSESIKRFDWTQGLRCS